MWDLTALANAAPALSSQVERHLWLVRLTEWLRHDAPAAAAADAPAARTPAPVLRLRLLLQQLDRDGALHAHVRSLVQAFWADIDAASLLAEMGFGARLSFASEVSSRLQAHVLPGTPETGSLAALFPLLFEAGDAAWLDAMDADTAERAARVFGPSAQQARTALLDATTHLASAVAASGHSPALRQRMDAAALRDDPFRQLTLACEGWRAAVLAGQQTATLQQANTVRALLAACRRAADSVVPHLEQFGVSVNIVFDLDQLHGRTRRIEQLLNCALALEPAAEVRVLMRDLLLALHERRSLRSLLSRHYALLARQVTERSAEVGEHYITRDRAEYRRMLRRAAGGGAVLAGTTFAKFGVMAIGLSAFWAGWWAGVVYAASFVVVMLLHWTVATKQPAMTAPAMAASLPAPRSAGIAAPEQGDAEAEAFIDRVAQLIRSQTAGIVGNLALCVPVVLAVQGLASVAAGSPLVGVDSAHYVLHSLTLRGPTLLFAAFTGVLLFASSLVAGWAENWFVLHRLDSALAWNPRIVARLGASRAQAWAGWWRANVSGLAANVSLGLMLGLVPALAAFVGLPLEVRHVTLASGQLAAAAGALGWAVLREPAFWWCVAGVLATGVVNVGVSFWLAFQVALRARGVRMTERSRIGAALRARLRARPLSFLWPPRDATPGG